MRMTRVLIKSKTNFNQPSIDKIWCKSMGFKQNGETTL